jgi:Wzt C-terminal domain
VQTLLGEVILHMYTRTAGVQVPEAPATGEVRCSVPRCPLPPGQYTITLWADQGGEPLDWIQRACEMTVREGDFYGSGQTQLPSHPAVLVDHAWTVSAADGTPAAAGAARSA